MNKLARSRAKDPNQEKLRAEKQVWNAKVSAFIDDLIHYKKWINGHDNKFFTEKSKITAPIPNDPASVISILMTDFQSLAGEGLAIVRNQKAYAESRGKTASEDLAILNKNASNSFSRLLAKFRGPIFSGSKIDKITNKYRISLLKVLSGIKDALRDLQVDILFKPVSDFPEIESEYSKLDIKVDELNSIYKSYYDLVKPVENKPLTSLEEDTPSSKIEIALKDIQGELIKATWLPILPKKQIHALNKRVTALLVKNAKNGNSNPGDILVEKNLIEHDFEDLRKNIFSIWAHVFPEKSFATIGDLLKEFAESDLSQLDLEKLTASLSKDLKSKNFKTDSFSQEILNNIQTEMEFSSKLPVNSKRQTHSLNKRVSNVLSKIDSGKFNQTDINVEINLIHVDYKKLLSDTLIVWRKILLDPLKNITTFQALYERFAESGISEEEIIDLAGGFPNTSKSKDVQAKFNLIVGEPQPTRHFVRFPGDGDRMIAVYNEFVEGYNGDFFKDFPLKEYAQVKTIVKSAKDREEFAAFVVKETVEAYNKVLLYFNEKFINADIIGKSVSTFTELFQLMPGLIEKVQESKFANVVTYNIGKQIGALKNKLSLGDKTSGLKIQLSDLFDFHVKNVNSYMNILEKRILTHDELNALSKDLEDFFKGSQTPFKALESSYIADNHEKVDSDSQESYNKNLKSVLKSKDKSRIKSLLK